VADQLQRILLVARGDQGELGILLERRVISRTRRSPRARPPWQAGAIRRRRRRGRALRHLPNGAVGKRDSEHLGHGGAFSECARMCTPLGVSPGFAQQHRRRAAATRRSTAAKHWAGGTRRACARCASPCLRAEAHRRLRAALVGIRVLHRHGRCGRTVWWAARVEAKRQDDESTIGKVLLQSLIPMRASDGEALPAAAATLSIRILRTPKPAVKSSSRQSIHAADHGTGWSRRRRRRCRRGSRSSRRTDPRR
jgi:hypothetical protein